MSNRLILTQGATFSIGAGSSLTTVFGTAAGAETLTIGLGAKVVLDASFNRGGDTVTLTGNASSYSAIRSGSSIILTDAAGSSVTIPVGTTGMSVAFADAPARNLVFDTLSGSVRLGADTVDGTVDPLAAGSTGVGVGGTFALTIGATDVIIGTDADDLIIGQFGQATTLQASDRVAAGQGTDTLRIVTDVNPAVPGASNVQGFTVTGVEILEVQAQNGAGTTLGLENVDTALTTIRSSSSNQALTVKNVNNLAALEIVNALNGANTTIAYSAAALAGTADVQSIKLNGNTVGTLTVGVNTDTPTLLGSTGVESVAISATGAASTVANLNIAASALTVTGDKNLTITAALQNTIGSVSASAFTGNLTVTTGNFGNTTSTLTVASGSGNDVLNLAAHAGLVSVTGGAGNDIIDLGAFYTSADTVSGGEGTDTVRAAGIGTVNPAQTFNNTTSVEALAFTGATSGTLNAGAFNATTNATGTGAAVAGVVSYDFQNGTDGAVTLSNVTNGSNILLNARAATTGLAGTDALTVTHVADTAGDTLNLTVTTDTADYTIGTFTANNAETLTITANDVNTTVTDATGTLVDVVTIAGLTAADLTTLNVAGNASVTVTAPITTGALAAVNAGTMTGNLVIALDDATDVSLATAQNVSVTSGSGNDSITLGGANNWGAYTVNTGNGNDTVNITSSNAAAVLHTIVGGNATTEAAGVADTGRGSITVTGALARANVTVGSGGYNITTSGGADTIVGGAGNDIIIVGGGNDFVDAGAGDDIIDARNAGGIEGVDTLIGGAGNDIFRFNYGTTPATEGITSADVVSGGEGTDTVEIMSDSAVLNDSIYNNWTSVEGLKLANGSNIVTLNAIARNAGLQSVVAGNGNDVINVGEGFSSALTIDLSAGGNDTVSGALATGVLTIRADVSDITVADVITGGTSGADTLVLAADAGTATLSGMTKVENVTVNAGTTATNGATIVVGADAVIADKGTLTVSAAGLTNASANLVYVGTAVTTATKTQNVTGGAGADRLFGGAGNDVFNGGAGNDSIRGGAGKDTLTGGAGADTFYYTVADVGTNSSDTITDFVTGTDKIAYNAAVTYRGAFGSFAAAQGAVTAGGGIEAVLDTSTNTLYIDANDDGTLNANDVQIVLTGVTTLAQGDFINAALTGDAFAVTGAPNVTKNGADTGSKNATTTSVLDTLTLNDTANLTGRVLTGFTDVTLAAGTITLSSAQEDSIIGGASVLTATGAQTLAYTDVVTGRTGRADIEQYNLATGNNSFTVGNLTQKVDAVTVGVNTVTVGGNYAGTLTGANSNDTLSLNAGANTTGATVGADFVNLTLADGGSATLTGQQHIRFAGTVAAPGANTLTVTTAMTDTGFATVESYNLVANSVFTLGAAGQNVAETGAGTTTVVLNNIAATGTFAGFEAGDILRITSGTDNSIVGVNGGAVLGLDKVDFRAVGASLSLTTVQHNGLTTMDNAQGEQTLKLTTAGTLTGRVGIENYNIVEGSVFTLGAAGQNVTETGTVGTASTVDLNGKEAIGTFAGFEAGDVLRVTASGSVAGVNTGGVLGMNTVDFSNATATLTGTQAQLNALTIVNGAATETQTFSVEDGDLTTITTVAGIDVYKLGDDTTGDAVSVTGLTGAQSLVAQTVGDAVTAQISSGVYTGALTGAGTDDVVSLLTGANISDATIGTGFLNLTIAAGGSVTLRDTQYDAFTAAGTLTAAGTETVTISDQASISISTANAYAIENVVAGFAGADTIAVTTGVTGTFGGGINIAAGGVDTITVTNAGVVSTDAVAFTVTGFGADDNIFIGAPASGFQEISVAGTALTLANGGVLEINTALGEILTPSNANAGAVEALIAAAVGSTSPFAVGGADFSVVVYGNGNAYIYQVDVTSVGPLGDFVTTDFAIELLVTLNFVAANSLVGANFA